MSIIVLPTMCMRSSGIPSARRFPTASSLWRKRHSAKRSATIRFTSSGIVRSKLRRPDSMWATGIPIFTAVSAAARVELTSPGTITRSGCSSSRTGSRRSIVRAVCAAWLPEPTSSMWSGAGTPSSSRKTSDISRS